MTEPNAELRRFRAALSEFFMLDVDESHHERDAAAAEVVLAAEALDKHLTRGGVLPDAWASAHRPTVRYPQAGRGPIAVPKAEPLGGPIPGLNGHVLPDDDGMVSVPKDSCEADHPTEHLQCWGQYGHEGPHFISSGEWDDE